MNRIRRHFVQAAVAASALTASLGTSAQVPAAQIKGSEWWQWALSIPVAANPLLDATGANCMVGQSGKTWFLAGTFNGGAASRVCYVPEGVQLIFPVANWVNIDAPNVCGQGASVSVAELRASSAQQIDGIKQFSATLDSRPLRSIRRLQSEVFPVALPAENVYNAPDQCGAGAVPAAIYPRAVDDGYYAEIHDLDVGEHTLHITATFANSSKLDVSYRLIIVPRDRQGGR